MDLHATLAVSFIGRGQARIMEVGPARLGSYFGGASVSTARAACPLSASAAVTAVTGYSSNSPLFFGRPICASRSRLGLSWLITRRRVNERRASRALLELAREKTGALRWPPSCRVHVCTCRCVRPSVRRRGPHENGKPSSPEQQGLCTVRACASRLLSNGGPSGRSTSGSWVGSSFLRRPRPPWFTLPSIACPPSFTVTCSTRTV